MSQTTSIVKRYFFLAAIFFLCMVYSCSWAPSDEQAVKLVKDYFLLNYEGVEVDAKIILRGQYIKDCKCYPVLMEITIPERETYKKTFYFFKNESGAIEVSEFQPNTK